MSSTKRVRVSRRVKSKPKKSSMEHVSREEEKALRLALANSKTMTQRVRADVPMAPCFYPTLDEFRKPLEYIVRLHSEGLVGEAGICKIIPPPGWKCPKPKLDSKATFPTKLQQLRHLQEGRLFRDGKQYDLPRYKAMADRFRKQYLYDHLRAELGGSTPVPPADVAPVPPATGSAPSARDGALEESDAKRRRVEEDTARPLVGSVATDNSHGAVTVAPAIAIALPLALPLTAGVVDAVAPLAAATAAVPECTVAEVAPTLTASEVADAVESEYWRVVETSAENIQVEYANDIDSTRIGSGFPTSRGSAAGDEARGAGMPRLTVSETARRSVDRARQSETLGMDDEAFYRMSGWNLNNTSSWEESMLQCLPDAINGISVPWMYFGMLFATFCWHIEDNFLYSINYMHEMPEGCEEAETTRVLGGTMERPPGSSDDAEVKVEAAASTSSSSSSSSSPSSTSSAAAAAVPVIATDTSTVKTWYGIPQRAYLDFEKVLKSHCPAAFDKSPDLLYRLTTLLSPNHLMSQGVPVVKLRQRPGEFVVTFPRAYHAGFSHGFTVGEAVNFAPVDWIPHGRSCLTRYRKRGGRPSVFNHEKLICDMARNAYTLSRPAHCDMLVEELRNIMEEEETGLRHLKNLQITNQHRLDNEALIRDDDLRQCCVCQHTCYLSSVVCRCSASNVSCLRCPHHMCDCPPNEKYAVATTSRFSV
jgi:hypothetical protein